MNFIVWSIAVLAISWTCGDAFQGGHQMTAVFFRRTPSFQPARTGRVLNKKPLPFGADGGYTGDKEIHILHLPKDRPLPDFEDIKLHLALTDAHKLPEIDLDLNRNLGNFAVTLPDGTTAPVLISSSSTSDLAKPLAQGVISSDLGNKKYTDVDHVAQYFSAKDALLREYFKKGQLSGQKTQTKGGGLGELPHIGQQPLENDPGRSSYNAPGAVDSYGHPVDHRADPTTKSVYDAPGLVDSYGNPIGEPSIMPNHLQSDGVKFEDFYNVDSYVNRLNELYDLHRKRRAETEERKNGQRETARHPNHRYD